MNIVVNIPDAMGGRKTLFYDKTENQYYLVFTSASPLVNKTSVYRSNGKGKIVGRNEVYALIPSNHDKLVDMLNKGVVTTADFLFYSGTLS